MLFLQGLTYDHVQLNFYLNGKPLSCPFTGMKGTLYPVFYGISKYLTFFVDKVSMPEQKIDLNNYNERVTHLTVKNTSNTINKQTQWKLEMLLNMCLSSKIPFSTLTDITYPLVLFQWMRGLWWMSSLTNSTTILLTDLTASW